MKQNEEFESVAAKKKWPKWIGILALVGIAAAVVRIFCKGGCCGKEDSCCKPSKAG